LDIKLKKYEEVYTPLKKLFSKPLRIVAFILAAVFAASAVAADGYSDMLGYDPTATGSYTDSTEYRSKLTDEYEQLCIYAVCYLNNLDSKGKFTGSDNLYADFTYYLDYNGYTYQKTDNGIEPYSELFDFYVSYKNADGKTRSLTNIDFDKSVTDDNRTEWLKSNFSNYILRSNDLITSDNASSGVMVDYTYCTAESGYFNNNGNETGDYYYYNDDYYSDSTNDFVYYGDYNGYSSADATTESYSDNFVPLGGWFYDNYGRYFYNFGNSSPIRFFEDSAKTKK
jgi:hypothetical protein